MNKVYESEKHLEEKMISQLVSDGWERIILPNDEAIFLNFRNQIEKHNLLQSLN